MMSHAANLPRKMVDFLSGLVNRISAVRSSNSETMEYDANRVAPSSTSSEAYPMYPEKMSPPEPESPSPIAYGSRVISATMATTRSPYSMNFLDLRNLMTSFFATM